MSTSTNPATSSNTDPPSSNTTRVLSLKSLDNENFEIKESVAKQSGVLKLMIEDGCFQGEIPLNNVNGKELSKIIDWCNKHEEEEEDGKQKKVSDLQMIIWEKEFINRLSLDDLYDMLLASNYLDVKPLLDCAAQRAADLIKGKTPEQIRKHFNIKNDFSAGEEAEVRRENSRAFE